MISCSAEINEYHDNNVKLTETQISTLRTSRNANRNRIKQGQEKNEKPVPKDADFVIQGSYAMRTQIQAEGNDFDIDDGVVFERNALKGTQNADMQALAARQMIKAAIEANSNCPEIEIKTNCVRAKYAAGYHVDIPVYRRFEGDDGDSVLEIASSDWKESDPKAVTQWFRNAEQQQTQGDDQQQLRRVVRLLKTFSRSRNTWNAPSGLILSVLLIESSHFVSAPGKDGESFRQSCDRIHGKLQWDLTVRHPVIKSEFLTKTDEDACMEQLRDHLADILDRMKRLDDADCSKKEALEIWGYVFNDQFFKDKAREAEDEEGEEAKAAAAAVFVSKEPDRAVNKKGRDQYA